MHALHQWESQLPYFRKQTPPLNKRRGGLAHAQSMTTTCVDILCNSHGRQSESLSSSLSPSICIPRRHLLHHCTHPVCIALSQSNGYSKRSMLQPRTALKLAGSCFVCFRPNFLPSHQLVDAIFDRELARDAVYVVRSYCPK